MTEEYIERIESKKGIGFSFIKSKFDDGSLLFSELEGKTIKSIRGYCAEEGNVTIAERVWHHDIHISFTLRSGNAERLLSSDFKSLVIRSSDVPSSLLLGYFLLDREIREGVYIVSSAGDILPSFISESRMVVSEERKRRVLLEYLSLFDVGSTVLCSGCEGTELLNMLESGNVHSVAVISKGEVVDNLPESALLIDADSFSVETCGHDNDLFKKRFLSLSDGFGEKIGKMYYAYLLNDIDGTDKLDTVTAIIREKIGHRLLDLEMECGTEILRNALQNSPAGDGTEYWEIVKFLVGLGLKYTANTSFGGDGTKMAYDLYDGGNIGKAYVVLKEQGYHISIEDEFEFLSNFIALANCNDSVVALDDSTGKSYNQRLDDARTREFQAMSVYIPDDVFSARDSEGFSLLHVAAKELKDLPKLFSVVLSRSAGVNVKDEDGCTPLHYVSDLERWNQLIQKGADPLIADGEGKYPKLEVTDEYVNAFLSRESFGENEKAYASRLLFSLIDDSYDPSVMCNRIPLMEKLLYVVDPDERECHSGYTFLMSALVQPGYFPDLYEKMLGRGVDVNARTSTGENALFVTVLSPECTAVKIRFLLSHGVDASLSIKGRGSVANVASTLFHFRSEEWNALWQCGDKSIFTYGEGKVRSPLYIALEHRNMPAIKFLLKHGAVRGDEAVEIREMLQQAFGIKGCDDIFDLPLEK